MAVVGTGFGCRAHVPALRAAGFDVVALVGQDPERTADRAAASGVPVATTSFTDALDLGLDAVSISSPPATHAPLTRQAVAAGCHLLVEKPFTLDAAEARELLALADGAGLVHLVAHEFRFAAPNLLGARLLADGAVGDPRLATFVSWMPYVPDPQVPSPAWWFDKEVFGGWLGAAGVHTLDQIRTWLGDVTHVRATLSVISDRPATVADDTFDIELTMASGCRVVLQQTAAAWGFPPAITAVAGPSGTLWVDGGRVWVADRAGSRAVDLPDDVAAALPAAGDDDPDGSLAALGVELLPFVGLTRHFRDRILGTAPAGGPQAATFADGVAVMEVVDAAFASAAAGGATMPVGPS
ncbi:MAG TPA: Gfo/Idh/MocA family oxidoreductase [Acidimicrobiales bacterium]|nr:Gfo/Idh/MocA family oxidoreductase [Acidimicrobiales bacterium]